MGSRPRGLFVAFEGIDGSGKSSTLRAVAEALAPSHPGLQVTREETEGPTGQAVRDAIAAHADPLAVAFLFVADRAQHVPWIRAHLEAGRHVLCDRYALSTYAYQSVTLRERMADPVAFLRTLHQPLALEPDHTLLFVADPARCVERVAKRGAPSAYEKVAFLAKVQESYLAIARGDPRVERLDSERPLPLVVADAQRIVGGWLDAGAAQPRAPVA